MTQSEIDFGPLRSLIDDRSNYQIMVNGPNQVYIERSGKMHKTEVSFRDGQHIIDTINNLLAAINPNLQVSPDRPIADARFPDGTRLQAFIPPIAVSGPSLTLRRAIPHGLTIENFVAWRTLTEDMASFLQACVKARLNIIIIGNVGSGKTTLLGILAQAIPYDERIVTIEEEAELRLPQEHVVSLERKPPDWEGKGEITLKDLLQMIPRARPGRIVIGELNGPEVFEALRLMDKGYDGTMASITANSPAEAVERLEMMVKMDEPNLPVSYLRSLVSAAVDLIVQQDRMEDGTRKIVRITEMLPMRGGNYDLHDIFVFQREGFEEGHITGQFINHSVSPDLLRRLEAGGITGLPTSLLVEAEQEQEAKAQA